MNRRTPWSGPDRKPPRRMTLVDHGAPQVIKAVAVLVLAVAAVALLVHLAGCATARADDAAAPVEARARQHHGLLADDMTLGPVARTALPGCDNPTPVRAPGGAIYSNASDCTPPGGKRLSTAWVRLEPAPARYAPSPVTATGSGASGKKLSGALSEDGGTLYLLERNLTRHGGMRLGRSAGVDKPVPTWTATIPDFGWGSFGQATPDAYVYVYLRDSRTAYGTADRLDLARVPQGHVAELDAWELFSGTADAPAWVPWTDRAHRAPVLTDPGNVDRAHASHLGGCWLLAVTVPPPAGARGGDGLSVYTSANPYGPWNRRYHATGVDLGESAQASPLWPGTLLLTAGDRFEWRSYTMPEGC